MARHARLSDVSVAAVHHPGDRRHAQLALRPHLLQRVRPAGGNGVLAAVRNLPGQCRRPGGLLHETERLHLQSGENLLEEAISFKCDV